MKGFVLAAIWVQDDFVADKRVGQDKGDVVSHYPIPPLAQEPCKCCICTVTPPTCNLKVFILSWVSCSIATHTHK